MKLYLVEDAFSKNCTSWIVGDWISPLFVSSLKHLEILAENIGLSTYSMLKGLMVTARC